MGNENDTHTHTYMELAKKKGFFFQIVFKKVKYYKTWGHSVYPNNPGFIIHLSESQFEHPHIDIL